MEQDKILYPKGVVSMLWSFQSNRHNDYFDDMENYKTPPEQVVKDHMWTKKFLSLLDDLITYFGI